MNTTIGDLQSCCCPKVARILNSSDNKQLLLRSRMAKDERTFRRKVESYSLRINQFVDLTHSLASSSFVRLLSYIMAH